MKNDLIIFAGAPGSGKTTVGRMLQKRLDSPLIDFGNLRIFHLDKWWKKANAKEEQMSFENLVFILKNYIKNGYKNTIVTDLKDDKVLKLTKIFSKNKIVVISLIVDDAELKRRVANFQRESGFRNIKKALEYNKKLKQRKPLKNEFRINNTYRNPKRTLGMILRIFNISK